MNRIYTSTFQARLTPLRPLRAQQSAGTGTFRHRRCGQPTTAMKRPSTL